MKRLIFSGSIMLLLASMAIVSYAAWQKIAISQSNLADLKGKWVGSRTIGASQKLNTDLEISNDTLPVQGKFIFYDVQRRDTVGSSVGASTLVNEFKCNINDQGNLLISGGSMEVELSLFEDGGKKKLEGTCFIRGARGTMSFTKK